MGISREQAKTITAEIDAAVTAIITKHGLSKDKVRTTYGEMYAYKIEATFHEVNQHGVNTSSREMDDLRYYAKFHGITDIDAVLASNETIHYNGKEYVPAGFRPRAKKQPFILKCVTDGKTYIFSDHIAKYFPSYDATTDTRNKSIFA